jgi:RNA polymerase sigma-70 factor (ECF subfamily)
VFGHINSYREAWPFEVWFTRVLINGCLDRRKARARRDRWFAPADEATGMDEARHASSKARDADPETRLLARERRARLAAAIGRLDGRQRTVFMLCHFGGWTPREVSAITALNESTVRVHLFRAARKLRGLLGGKS